MILHMSELRTQETKKRKKTKCEMLTLLDVTQDRWRVCDARRPRWGMQLWDVCIHSAFASQSRDGGWAQLKDIWMRWNAICLNNQESYQSHPMCTVLLVHTCAMCFSRNGYWQMFYCDSLVTFFLFFLCIVPINKQMWRRNGGRWRWWEEKLRLSLISQIIIRSYEFMLNS